MQMDLVMCLLLVVVHKLLGTVITGNDVQDGGGGEQPQ